jgi:hypothetical protein
MAYDGSNLFAGTRSMGIFISADNGNTWSPINNGLVTLGVGSILLNGLDIFIINTGSGGVFKSSNNGASWTGCNNGITSQPASIISSSNSLFVSYNGGVYKSTNNGASWFTSNNGLPPYNYVPLAVSGSTVYAGVGAASGGVYMTTNNGLNWTNASIGLPANTVMAMIALGSNIFSGTWGSGVYLSNNNGASWIPVNSGLTNSYILSFTVNGTDIYAGTYGGGLFMSRDTGNTWTEIGTGISCLSHHSILVTSLDIFAGTGGNSVWRRSLNELLEVPDEYSEACITVLPNPASDKIFVEVNGVEVGSLSLFDVYGKLVDQVSEFKNSIAIPLSNLTNGIYFLLYSSNTKQSMKKIVVQHNKQ